MQAASPNYLPATTIAAHFPISRASIYRLLKEGRIRQHGKLFSVDEILAATRPKPVFAFVITGREVWEEVPGWPNYMVSDNGFIYQKVRTERRMPGILKPQLATKSGYYQVQLIEGNTRKFIYIHQLVATVFIDNPKCYNEVNHIDLNKHNNTVDNLEWCTHQENIKHFHRTKK